MRETRVNYCPKVLNTSLSCKILKGRLPSVIQQGKDQFSKQKSWGSLPRTQWLPPATGLYHQRQVSLRRALPGGCRPEKSPLLQGLLPCVLAGDYQGSALSTFCSFLSFLSNNWGIHPAKKTALGKHITCTLTPTVSEVNIMINKSPPNTHAHISI